MMRGWFITGTGTGVGKTYVTRGLTRALLASGVDVAPIKPIETGCAPHPQDAQALDRASGLAFADAGFYRVPPPVAPLAATLMGHPPLSLAALADTIALVDHDVLLVEGAGGVLVPLTRTETVADLIATLRLPVVLVAADQLGVLSYTATALGACERAGLQVDAIALARHAPRDESRDHNLEILRTLHGPEVFVVDACEDDDDTLGDALAPLAAHLVAKLAPR